MEFKRGDICINQHPYAFRSGEPYKILNIQDLDDNKWFCYYVQFADGYIAWFPVNNTEARQMKLYEKGGRVMLMKSREIEAFKQEFPEAYGVFSPLIKDNQGVYSLMSWVGSEILDKAKQNKRENQIKAKILTSDISPKLESASRHLYKAEQAKRMGNSDEVYRQTRNAVFSLIEAVGKGCGSWRPG